MSKAAAILRRALAEAALIEVHGYDLNRLLLILNQAGVSEVTASTTTGHTLQVTLFFRKP